MKLPPTSQSPLVSLIYSDSLQFSQVIKATLPLFYLLLPVNVDLLPSSLARKTCNSFPRGLVLCSSSSYGHSRARLFSRRPRSDTLSIS